MSRYCGLPCRTIIGFPPDRGIVGNPFTKDELISPVLPDVTRRNDDFSIEVVVQGVTAACWSGFELAGVVVADGLVNVRQHVPIIVQRHEPQMFPETIRVIGLRGASIPFLVPARGRKYAKAS